MNEIYKIQEKIETIHIKIMTYHKKMKDNNNWKKMKNISMHNKKNMVY